MRRGSQWLRAGGGFGLLGGIVAILLPFLFIWLAKYDPGGFFTFATSFVQFTSLLFLVGSVLVLVSFFCYRWSFSVLRKANPRYWIASALCLIGSSGLLILVIAAGLAAGDANSFVGCAQGSLSNAFSCIQSASPVSAYAALLGFWLGWIGAVGIVIGLFHAAGSFRSALYGTAGALYLILIVLLVGPFVAVLAPVSFVSWLLLVVPAFAIAAPALVVAARPTLPALAPPPGRSHPPG